MLQQVSFPPGYLNETDGAGEKRFRLKYRATDKQLEAGIVGRFTPTSLARFTPSRARFARTGRRGRRQGLEVRIQPGSSATLRRAFLVNLRSGNIGLGIRLKEGETLEHTIGAKLITSGPLAGVALLYGPSVDQVFRTVAVEISPAILDHMVSEFLRQFARLSKDGRF